MGWFNSGRGILWPAVWGWMHAAKSEIDRNLGEELFFTGRDTPGNVNLIGQGARTRQGTIARYHESAATGEAATTAAGTLGTEIFIPFVYDSFTESSDTFLPAHTPEIGGGWLYFDGGGEVNPWVTAATDRLTVDPLGNWQFYATAYATEVDYSVGATVRYTGSPGYYTVVELGVVARAWMDWLGIRCYTFGYATGYPGWVLERNAGGSSELASDLSSFLFTNAGETADIRMTVTTVDASTVNIKCYVNGTILIDYNDYEPDRVIEMGQAAIKILYPSFEMDSFYAGAPYVPPPGTVYPTGLAATTARGSLTPNLTSPAITGRSATTAYGTLTPVVEVVPLGRSATGNNGVIEGQLGGNIVTAVQGYRATTASGAPSLEYVALIGHVATTGRGDIGPDTPAALTGLQAVATDGQIFFDPRFVYDTFTDTNATALTAHTGEVGATWTSAYSSGTPPVYQVLSNEVKLAGSATGYRRMYASGVPLSADYQVSANFQYYGNADGWSNAITEGIAARMNTAGTAGYVFGYNGYAYEWQLEKLGTGRIAGVNQGAWDSYVPHEFKIVVSGSATTNIKCYLDGTEIISYDDSTSPVTAANYAGLAAYEYINPKGSLDAFQASLSGVGSSVRLYGARGTTAGGGVGAAKSEPLTGYAATTASGALVPRVVMGYVSAATTIVPHLVATPLAEANTNNNFFGNMSEGFISVNGVLCGVGEFRDYNAARPGFRRAVMQVSQITRETATITDDGTQYFENYNPYGESLEAEVAAPLYQHFPRNHTYNTQDTQTYKFNGATVNYGMFSADRNGEVQTLWERTYVLRGSTNISYVFFYDSTTLYVAWQGGYLDGSFSNYYNGPELLLGRTQYAPDTGDLRVTLDVLGTTGFYAVRPREALVFYPTLRDSSISGAYVRLAGERILTLPGTVTKSSDESHGVELVGLRAIATAFDASTNYSEYWWHWGAYVWDLTAKDAHGELVGHRLLANEGQSGQWGGSYNQARLYPIASNLNAPLLWRRLKDGVWGAENELAFTGADHSWVIPGSMVVTHSGYGNIIYVTYASSLTYGQTPHTTPTHLGLLVMDAVSGTVFSNALTAMTDAEGDSLYSKTYERTKSEVVTLNDGTSLTQFTQKGQTVKLSWTYATRTAPTLTLKTGPTGITVGWESLEIRGDEVYHVFWNAGQAAAVVKVNDAVSSNSTWTTYTASQAGTIPGLGTWEEHDYISGFGSGQQTWLYDVIRTTGLFGVTAIRAGTRWANFWAAHASLLSVATEGRLGNVGVSITPNVALTGLRATTTPGAVFGLVNGDAHAALVGRAATARYYPTTFARIDFVLDTFTDGPSVDLDPLNGAGYHVGEVGATWVVNTNQTGVHVFSTYAGTYLPQYAGNSSSSHAEGVPPSADYSVTAVFGMATQQTSQWGGQINMGVGVRMTDSNSDGYYFGFNQVDRTYLLTRTSAGNVLASYHPLPSGWTSGSRELRVEIFGEAITTIRCYVNDVLVIEYVDMGFPLRGAGHVGFVTSDYDYSGCTINSINGFYWDPSAIVPLGQRATTAQGVFDFTDRTVALTGRAATMAYGTLTPDLTIRVALTGQAATTAQGSIDMPDRTVALVGRSATTTAGVATPQPPIFVALTGTRVNAVQGFVWFGGAQLEGRAAILQWGDLLPRTDDTDTLVGHAAAAAPGLITPEVSTSTLGRGLTTARGTLTSVVAVAYWNFRSELTMRAGGVTPSADTAVQLTGLRTTTAQGSPAQLLEDTNAATGYASTTAYGVLVPVLVVSLTGARATGGAGGVIPLLAVTPTGRQAVSSQGVLQLLTNIFLTGRSGTCAPGGVGYTYGSTAVISGVYSRGELGDVTQGMWKPRAEHLLWVFTEPEEPEADDAPEEEYVRVT
jgi:hypothetical protein